jgi:hypothetical protein
MNPPFLPLTLGDIFEKTFSLIGRTFFRNLLIAVVILLFPIILMAIATDAFYSSLADMQGSISQIQNEPGLDMVLAILGPLVFFGCVTIIFALGILLAEIAVSIIVSREILSNPITFFDTLHETFSMKCLYGIGQGILKYAILIGGIVIAGIVIAMLSAVTKVFMGIFTFLGMLVLFPVLIYAAIKWYFALTAVAVDDLTVVESLRKSWYLVEGHWWRTFGILILLSILSQFIITIISLPITFGSMWDFYKEYFTILGKTGGNIDPASLAQLEKSVGPGIAIGSGISALLTLLITPVFTVVMYYDLRARENTGTTSKQKPIVMQDTSSEPIDLSSI